MNADNIFILSLCIFIALLAFKPSEPYLSEFLICNFSTEESYCKTFHSLNTCSKNVQCQWTNEISSCSIKPCSSLTGDSCTKDISYCTLDVSDNNQCVDDTCYKSFTANQVNNEIYPWSTYSYLIFLVFLTIAPMTNLLSYRVAIVCGVMGRAVTRFLLLYGTSIFQMKIMQVTYALGTAAEDLFAAYIYSVVPVIYYQKSTSYLKTSAMLSSVIASLLGDLLVTQYHASLMTLMMISATFVTVGAIFGTIILKDPIDNTNNSRAKKSSRQHMNTSSSSSSGLNDSDEDDEDDVQPSSPKLYTKKTPVVARPSTTYYINGLSNCQFLMTCSGEKYFHFMSQISLIVTIIMKSRFLKLFLIWWVIGSSVYTLLISYEVSIYSELNGGDKWNGSVLAIMLLSGCFGAMLPVWLKIDLLTTTPSSTAAIISSSSAQNTNTHIHPKRGGTNNARNNNDQDYKAGAEEGEEEGTEFSDVDNDDINSNNTNTDTNNNIESNELRVVIYLTIAGIISTTCVVIFVLFWELYVSILSLIVFLAAWQFINVVFLAKLATYINEHCDLTLSGDLSISSAHRNSSIVLSSKNKNKNNYEVVSLNPLFMDTSGKSDINYRKEAGDDDDDYDLDKKLHGSNDEIKYKIYNMKSKLKVTGISGSTIASTDIDNDDDEESRDNQSRGRRSGNANSYGNSSSNTDKDSPHSVAVMFVVVLSVSLQVILQAVLFSWLNLSLYMVSVVLMIMYCSSTFLYVTAVSAHLWCK